VNCSCGGLCDLYTHYWKCPGCGRIEKLDESEFSKEVIQKESRGSNFEDASWKNFKKDREKIKEKK
jgi:hypothetical protein